jgi:hypothetical protein
MDEEVKNILRLSVEGRRKVAFQELKKIKHMIEAESFKERKSEEESNKQEFIQQPDKNQSNVQRP